MNYWQKYYLAKRIHGDMHTHLHIHAHIRLHTCQHTYTHIHTHTHTMVYEPHNVILLHYLLLISCTKKLVFTKIVYASLLYSIILHSIFYGSAISRINVGLSTVELYNTVQYYVLLVLSLLKNQLSKLLL